MNIGTRIKISSLHTSNYVIRTIENQEQLEKYRELDGYDVTIMPVMHNTESVCVAFEG